MIIGAIIAIVLGGIVAGILFSLNNNDETELVTEEAAPEPTDHPDPDSDYEEEEDYPEIEVPPIIEFTTPNYPIVSKRPCYDF